MYIFPGTVLTLQNNANLLFQGPIIIEGDKDNPVIIQSKKDKGGGLLILESKKRSKLKNVLFYGLSAPKYKGLNLSELIFVKYGYLMGLFQVKFKPQMWICLLSMQLKALIYLLQQIYRL